MRILVYEWNGFGQKDLRDSLAMLGHRVERIGYVVRERCEDLFFEEKLSKRLKKGYDLVISFNFFPSVAKCCKDARIPYFSWMYDGDDIGLYHESIYFDTNYIFTFDRAMLKRLKAKGVMQIWYLPLGVNIRRLDAIRYSQEDYESYRCDLSFIGNMYQNKQSLDLLPYSDYTWGYIEGILKAQLRINFNSMLDELMTPELVAMMAEIYPPMDSRYTMQQRDSMRNMMATSITQRERFLIVKKLSEHYSMDLYTYSNTEDFPNVRAKGVIGYFTGMPRVFKFSKINLNISHRMIATGIPLRVMDVLGVGGFLMSNYQQDMGEEFRDGEHLAIYYSVEDLVEKTGFYLQHDEERKRIAHNGHELVCKKFTMEKLLTEMFQMASIAI